jgi:hypothetical protein
LQDKNLNQLATIGQEMSCVTEEIAADSGGATVVIRGGDYLGDFVRNAVRIEAKTSTLSVIRSGLSRRGKRGGAGRSPTSGSSVTRPVFTPWS